MSSGENTPDKHRGLKAPWQAGQSGNPLGRPKGSRSKLGEAFIDAMHADFLAHGPAVVEKVRIEKPDQYLKVIASILPKELHVKDVSLEDMSDNELIDILDTVRTFAASASGSASKPRTGKAQAKAGVRKEARGIH